MTSDRARRAAEAIFIKQYWLKTGVDAEDFLAALIDEHAGIGELEERAEAYEVLVGLLRKRFPPRADGSLPDYRIEDVLRERDALAKRIEDAISSCEYKLAIKESNGRISCANILRILREEPRDGE